MKPETRTTTTETQTATRQYRIWELPTTADEMKLCELIRFLDLRAMNQSNGESSALRDIIHGCYLDKLWEANADRNSYAVDLKALAKAERAEARRAEKYLDNLTISAEDRATYTRIAHDNPILADSNSGEAQDAEKLNNALTASLAQDMLHHIWIELQAIKADPDRHTDSAFGELCKAGREYIQSLTQVNTLDRVNTISRPLTTAEAVYYMTRYNADPKARPRQSWKQTAKGCTGYYTLEPKERKRDTDPRKVDPAIIANYARYNDACIWYYEHITLASTNSGHTTAFPALDAKTIATHFWHRQTQAQKCASLELDPAENPVLYLVLHVPTIRTHHSTEELTDHDPRTAETITDNVLHRVDVIALAERAKLSAQARTAVEALTHPEALTQAKTAYNEAIQNGENAIEKLQADRAKANKKQYAPGKVRQMRNQYKQTADNAYTSALWGYALTKAGYTQTAQAKAKCVIIDKLNRAYKTAPDNLTPGQIDYSAMMRSAYRGHTEATTTPRDALKWTATTTANHKPVVRFTDSGNAPEAITPGIDYRTAEVLNRDSYRQTAPKATPPALTPKEQRERERLCKREAELAELWKQFESTYGLIDNPYMKRYAKA